MAELMQYALDFMAVYGLIAVFVLLVLDGAALLPAVPGEVVLIIAINQYAHDVMGLFTIYGIAVAAAMVGSFIVYGIGRGAAGRPGKPRKKVLGMSPKKLEKMERTFARPSGQSLVLILRLFPLTRVLVSLPAGVARMPAGRFFFLSLTGMALFYAGFIWLTYEFRDPTSPVAATAANLQTAAYDSPAWTFVETNWIVTGLMVLVFGIILSVRASIRMARDPDETSGSLIGTLATMVLFWGGIGLLAGLWLNDEMVFESLTLGGMDVEGMTWGHGYDPFWVLAGAGGLSILLGLLLRSIRSSARRRNKEKVAAAEKAASADTASPAQRIGPYEFADVSAVRFERVGPAPSRGEPNEKQDGAGVPRE